MSFWNIFGKMAVSDDGATIQKLSETFSVSSDGVTYTTMGNSTTGFDGTSSILIGNAATGLGAVFTQDKDV